MPAARNVSMVSSIAVTIRSRVSRSATSRIGSCEVTRAFQRLSSLLYSLHRPLHCSTSAAHRISSGYGLPPRLSASLLNGVNITPSSLPALAASSTSEKFLIAKAPPSALGSPRVMRAGSRCFRSMKAGRPAWACSGEIAAARSSVTPATFSPSANTLRSPNTATAARPIKSERASSFASNSGLTPAGSPIAIPIRGVSIFLSPRRPGDDLHIAFNQRVQQSLVRGT